MVLRAYLEIGLGTRPSRGWRYEITATIIPIVITIAITITTIPIINIITRITINIFLFLYRGYTEGCSLSRTLILIPDLTGRC